MLYEGCYFSGRLLSGVLAEILDSVVRGRVRRARSARVVRGDRVGGRSLACLFFGQLASVILSLLTLVYFDPIFLNI